MADAKRTRAPGAFMTRYGANVAGFFWNAGTALQFLFGLIVWSPLQIASSIVNVMLPCSYIFFGHKNWGIAVGGVLGIIGTFLAVYPGLVNGEASSIFGFGSFCIFVLFNIFSPQLTRRFGKAEDSFARATLGHPRRVSGFGAFLCTRLPIIAGSLLHGRWPLAAVFAVWGLGDIALSFSRPNAGKG